MTDSKRNEIHYSPRFLAYESLFSVFEKKAYANIVIQKTFRSEILGKADRSLYTELVYGICRRYRYLLWLIEKLSTRSLSKMHPSVRILLCIGLYQLLFLDRIPESAAVNETMKVAKRVTHGGNGKFVNGVLRNFLRKKEIAELPEKNFDSILYRSLLYNQPEWLIRRWDREWGSKRTNEVMKSFNDTAPLVVRCNTLAITPSACREKMESMGMATETSPLGEGVFRVVKGAHAFFDYFLPTGLAYVQSEASMIPVSVLAPQEDERILDMCAAPGGKTTQAAQQMNNTGYIAAWDVHPHKIDLIENNARRLGITNVHAECRDATQDYAEEYGQYDRVLLDAPCSGLGVLGHKSELRWRRTEKELSRFPPLQRSLLERGANYVKVGGILVYSTCTLNQKENEEVIIGFLESHPHFEPLDFEVADIGISEKGMMTLYPYMWHSDGFFIARLKRRCGNA